MQIFAKAKVHKFQQLFSHLVGQLIEYSAVHLDSNEMFEVNGFKLYKREARFQAETEHSDL